MPRSRKKNFIEEDIVVFSFEKIQNKNERFINLKSYKAINSFLNSLITNHGIKSNKIGFGGYVTDLAFCLTCLIEKNEIDASLFEIQTDEMKKYEFDPDFVPNKI